jgi:hypothetical protein
MPGKRSQRYKARAAEFGPYIKGISLGEIHDDDYLPYWRDQMRKADANIKVIKAARIVAEEVLKDSSKQMFGEPIRT